MRIVWGVITVIVVLSLAGCGGGGNGDQPATQPAVDSPSMTPLGPSPLPPTWTDVPPGFKPSNTPAAESAATPTRLVPVDNVESGGTPLPPTWTPGRRSSITPVPSEPVPALVGSPLPSLTPPPSFTPLPAICAQLDVVGSNFHTKTGQALLVQWTPIPGIEIYRIDLRHPGGGLVLTQVVAGTSFEFSGDLFTVEGAYGWSVSPLDSSGADTCYPTGDEIIVTRY